MDDNMLFPEPSVSGRSRLTDWAVLPGENALFSKETPGTVHWSIPWSDLMMTMFILFVILYIYHASSGKASLQQGSKSMVGAHMAPGADMAFGQRSVLEGTFKESISNIYDLSKETVRENDLENFASVDLVPNKAVRIVLAGDLLFDTGKADLKPEARHSLRRIAGVVRQTPYVVNVVGHTDNVPIHSEKFPSNWELSAVRACRVARFLLEETQLPETRLFISGHAHHEPVFANTSDTNRAANRRVEIIITKEKPNAKPGTLENTWDLGPSKGDRGSPTETWPWNTF